MGLVCGAKSSGNDIFKLTDYRGGQCIHKGLFEWTRPYISGLALIIYSIIVRSESKMHKTSHEMEMKRLLCG